MIAALVLAAALHQPPEVLSPPHRSLDDGNIYVTFDVNIATVRILFHWGGRQGTGPSCYHDAFDVGRYCKLVRPRNGDDFYRCKVGRIVYPSPNCGWFSVQADTGGFPPEEWSEEVNEPKLSCDAGSGTGCPCALYPRTDPSVPCEYP